MFFFCLSFCVFCCATNQHTFSTCHALSSDSAHLPFVIIVVKIYILFIDTIFIIINNLNWRLSFPLSSRPTSYRSTPEHQFLHSILLYFFYLFIFFFTISHFPRKFHVVFLCYMVSLIFLPASVGGMGERGGAFHCTMLSLIQVVSIE